ncbi:protein kinase [Desmophyllum pertusum]|uniref:Protein kinase n=1 Tax=Desmophyllum pertusum TaxID=174260 RepID=A0A9W9ZFW5_9CNID|nr:protein kinase [Desmophyllum pertusum]
MAVCLDPHPEHLCLVMEHFEFASLNHLLYKTQIEMNLPERVHCLLDVAEGMTFLHNHSIIHGFLNSFSVFIYEAFRAKIGNLEFSQENGEQKQENACSVQESWMAPEQLLHEPPNMAGDAYSFGVLMWEILARKLPWSWLMSSTVKQALCLDEMTLPMLELGPNYIQSIMNECLQDPADRPSFCTVHEHLLAIKNRGEGLTSEVLDGAFPDWHDFQCGAIYAETRGRRAKMHSELLSRSSSCGTSEIYVMLRRSSSQGNGRRRNTSVRGGLKDVLKIMSNRVQDSPREKEIERFGYEIAEQLAVVRSVRRHARNYTRANWAKEVVLTRTLEGDIERVKKKEKIASSAKKRKFEQLLTTSSKYLKNDWSKVLHGMEKLKNSMKGFKGKVNEELIEYGRKPLTDDDSVSEHSMMGYEETGVVKDIDRADSQAVAKDLSRELSSLWENNRSTQRPDTGSLPKTQHSKVSVGSPAQPDKTRRKSVRKETAGMAQRKGSDVTSVVTKGGRVNRKNRPLDSEDEINNSYNDVHVYAEPDRSRGKSARTHVQDITKRFKLRASTSFDAQSALNDR